MKKEKSKKKMHISDIHSRVEHKSKEDNIYFWFTDKNLYQQQTNTNPQIQKF